MTISNATFETFETAINKLKATYMEQKEKYNHDFDYYKEDLNEIQIFTIYGKWTAEQLIYNIKTGVITSYMFSMNSLNVIAKRINEAN
jgi:ribosomal protein S4